MKKCKHCAEEIQDKARVCKHCGRKQPSSLSGFVWKGTIVFVVLWAVSMFTDSAVQVSSNPAQVAAQRKQEQQTTGLSWSYSKTADSMGRGEVNTASVRSLNEVEFDFPYGGRQRATITLRQRPQGKDVFLQIERGQFLCHSDTCKVQVRFDDGPIHTYNAGAPSDNSTETVFIGNYTHFIQNARKSKRASVQATFYQEGSPTFNFKTEGLEWK